MIIITYSGGAGDRHDLGSSEDEGLKRSINPFSTKQWMMLEWQLYKTTEVTDL